MANKAIITQAEFEDLRYRLGIMASSLSFHANDDLSNGHGINVIITPETDGNGNPTDQYYDQYGNVVGPYHVGFVVNNTPYYAPGQSTALDGNPATTGITDVDDGEFRQAGDSAWITQFTTPLTTDIDILIDQQLIPHTLLGHWESHGGMTVVPENIYNDAGILVANNTIRMAVNGIVYKIPVHTRKGGPKQAWQDFRFSTGSTEPFQYNVVQRFSDDDQVVRFYYADGHGTLPRTVELQINFINNGTSDNWYTVPVNGPTDSFTPSGGSLLNITTYEFTYPSGVPIQSVRIRAFQGSNSLKLVGTFRLKITAAAGTDNVVRYSRWIQFYAADTDGGIISGASSKTKLVYNAGLPGATEYGPIIT